jgi:hypothetical protein
MHALMISRSFLSPALNSAYDTNRKFSGDLLGSGIDTQVELREESFEGILAVAVSPEGLGNNATGTLSDGIQEFIAIDCWFFDCDQLPLLSGDGQWFIFKF